MDTKIYNYIIKKLQNIKDKPHPLLKLHITKNDPNTLMVI